MVTGKKRLGRWLLGLLVAYGLTMVFGGLMFARCARDQVADRLGRALGGEVQIASTSLSVWRGRLVLDGVIVTRPRGGSMNLSIGTITADVAGWGGVVFDRDVDRVVARKVALEISAKGAIDVARLERQPLEVGELIIEDASIGFTPTALLPGLGRVEVDLRRAVSRPVVLSGAMTWLRGLESLDGDVSLPGGIEAGATYAGRQLVLRGGLFGATPVSVPFEVPVLDPSGTEIDHARTIARAVIAAAGSFVIRDMIKDRMLDGVRGLLD